MARKRTRKRTKRKTNKVGPYKNRNGQSSFMNMGRPGGILLPRRASLRYCATEPLTSTAGAIHSVVYSANSAYDPKTAAGGHQPMGYDTFSALYNHYVVVGSKITVKFISESQQIPTICGIYLSDSQTVPYTTYQEFREARKGTQGLLGSLAIKPVTAISKFSAKKFFNLDNVKDNFDRLGALVTANPEEQAYYMIFVQSADYANTGSEIQCLITIDYLIEYSEPVDLAQS